MKSVLYTIAKNGEGDLVNAYDVSKGDQYSCPVCDTKLILRKSGNTGRGAKRPHFAHRALTQNCTPETALHFLFKTLVAEAIERSLRERQSRYFQWKCKYCDEEHSGNLMKRVSSIKVEHDLGVCQPDISFFSNDGRVFSVIEVVVTHKPEKHVLNYYQENDIVLVQYNLTSDTELNDVENRIGNPDFVGFCFNPICDVCGKYKLKTRMLVIDAHCWSCSGPMKVAMIYGDGLVAGTHIGPDQFTKKEIEFAASKGVLIDTSNHRNSCYRYVACICPTCRSLVGKHYLLTSYFAPAMCGELPSSEYLMGYDCDHHKPDL